METCAKRLRVPVISLILAALVLLPSHVGVKAGYPHGAYYAPDTDKVFWFIHASDLHVGACDSFETERLQWLVTTARDVIDPQFIVVTGDLTDSTDCNWLGYPNGPHQAEWDEYKAIVDGAGAGPTVFYDLPGNHDAYNDRYFEYYLANSVQGRATGGTQVSWTRSFPFGKYHFLGVNSADNTGAPFSIFAPYGDHAGLDASELAYINQQLTPTLINLRHITLQFRADFNSIQLLRHGTDFFAGKRCRNNLIFPFQREMHPLVSWISLKDGFYV